jgi:hypothetical protein
MILKVYCLLTLNDVCQVFILFPTHFWSYIGSSGPPKLLFLITNQFIIYFSASDRLLFLAWFWISNEKQITIRIYVSETEYERWVLCKWMFYVDINLWSSQLSYIHLMYINFQYCMCRNIRGLQIFAIFAVTFGPRIHV